LKCGDSFIIERSLEQHLKIQCSYTLYGKPMVVT